MIFKYFFLQASIELTKAALSTVWGWNHDGVGINFWDAEVSAEMNEVEGPEFAGDLDDAHVAGRAGEHGNAGDVRAGEVQPEVGDGVAGLGGVGGGLVGVDEVLPAGCVIGVDDGIHRLRRVESRAGIAVVVDGDGGECSGGTVGVHTIGLEKILSYLNHAAIEAE
jgi:hypothetical protein